jgi:poly(glycerol-phosphate) alpha-glucosyltransferase
LTGSVSRQAGGTFDAIRRPCSILATNNDASIQVLGTTDSDTESDRSDWQPLTPETFAARGPRGFGFVKGMETALEQFQPDIQHVHGIWMYYSMVNHRYHRQHKTPYVVSPHGMLDPWAVQSSAWKKRLVGWAFERKHLASSSCLHALSVPELAAIRGFGLKNPVCVIPNGVDLPRRQGHAAPWQSYLPHEAKVLLYLGRLHPKKGLVNLLHAWRQATTSDCRNGKWVLALAGWDQGGHEAELKKLSAELGLKQSVKFLGPQFGTAKQACYENADAFILPSFSEGLPMTVLEAWAYKLTVMMTPQCNIPEGFDSGASLKIETEPNVIASGLEALFSMTDAQRAEMGSRGYSLVQQKFTWGKVAAQFHEVYQWVLGGGHPPECVVFD